MTDLRAKLLEFHTAMGVPIATVPAVPAEDRVRLRARLIVEECLEFVDACFGKDDPPEPSRLSYAKAHLDWIISKDDVRVDLPEAADALADIAYVVFGAALEFGLDLDAVLEEVHRANLRKVGGGNRADGKIAKPKSWQPPDVSGVLRLQGWKP